LRLRGRFRERRRMYNWRTDFDWTDPDDGPASWEELDKTVAPWDRPEPKRTLKVRFLNGPYAPDGSYGPDSTLKKVSVVRQELCSQTLMPLLIIQDPERAEETLECRWYDEEWVCGESY